MTQANGYLRLNGSPCVVPDPKRYPKAAELANSYRNPRGPEPGRAYCLMLWGYLRQFTVDTSFTLEFSYGETASVGGLRMLRADRLLPGGSADDNALYLVELEDVRGLWKRFTSLNRQYNVRKPVATYTSTTATEFYDATLNAGSLWTWQTMLNDMWQFLPGGGTMPTLPGTPDPSPQNWRFIGVSAWDAFHAILNKLNWTTIYNPLTAAWTIIDLGTATQSGLSAIEQQYRYDLLDTESYESVGLRVPRTIRVFFHAYQLNNGEQWQEIPATTRDVLTGVTGAASGTILPIWDDLPALYSVSGSLSNAAALTTRAAERTAHLALQLQQARGRRVYSGIAKNFLPGTEIREVTWKSCGRGPMTEVVKGAELQPGFDSAQLLSEALGPVDLLRRRAPWRECLLGKISGALTAGGTTDVVLWEGDIGSEAASSVTISGVGAWPPNAVANGTAVQMLRNNDKWYMIPPPAVHYGENTADSGSGYTGTTGLLHMAGGTVAGNVTLGSDTIIINPAGTYLVTGYVAGIQHSTTAVGVDLQARKNGSSAIFSVVAHVPAIAKQLNLTGTAIFAFAANDTISLYLRANAAYDANLTYNNARFQAIYLGP